jgi:hypothetical protein
MISLKKSAVGATTVTLVPSTQGSGSENKGEAGITQVVITTGAVVPPPAFWGLVAADGMEFLLTVRKRLG